jgi:hypothetical protein
MATVIDLGLVTADDPILDNDSAIVGPVHVSRPPEKEPPTLELK